MRRGSRNSGGDEAVIGCIAGILLIIFLMPFAGIYLVTTAGNDESQRMFGFVLIAISALVFLVMMASGAH